MNDVNQKDFVSWYADVIHEINQARAEERNHWRDKLAAILMKNVVYPEALASQFYGLLHEMREASMSARTVDVTVTARFRVQDDLDSQGEALDRILEATKAFGQIKTKHPGGSVKVSVLSATVEEIGAPGGSL